MSLDRFNHSLSLSAQAYCCQLAIPTELSPAAQSTAVSVHLAFISIGLSAVYLVTLPSCVFISFLVFACAKHQFLCHEV